MFQIGDMVKHAGEGVCKITDVRMEKFSAKSKQYYILQTIYDEGKTTLYVPVDGEKATLQRLLSREEVLQIIHSVSLDEIAWIENNTQRQTAFTDVLRRGDQRELIQLIALLYQKKMEKGQTGKSLCSGDVLILQKAKKRIHEEFASALQLTLQEIAPFIMQELGIKPL